MLSTKPKINRIELPIYKKGYNLNKKERWKKRETKKIEFIIKKNVKQKYVFFLQNDEEKLIHQCFRAGNKQALFWVGAHK